MFRTAVRFYVRRAGRILSLVGIRFFQIGDPDIVRLRYRRRLAVLLVDYCYLVGDRWSFNFSLVGFKPDPIVVCSDPQGGNVI